MKPWTDNAIAMRNQAEGVTAPDSLVAAIQEERAFSWLPRAEKDRRQIERFATAMRRVHQRRKA